MTPTEIRSAINADPAILALVPDTQAIADALSVGRVKVGTVSREWMATWSASNGMRAVMQDVSETVNHPLRSIALATLDVLAGAADGIDLSQPQNIAMVQAWVTAGAMPQIEADNLVALATTPDPVTAAQVEVAIKSDNGELLV